MTGAAGRLGKRVGAVEARHQARQGRIAADPSFDPARLTDPELAELEPLKRRVAWRGGRPDFGALSDEEFHRLASLYLKGKGRTWHGGT